MPVPDRKRNDGALHIRSLYFPTEPMSRSLMEISLHEYHVDGKVARHFNFQL